MFTLLIVDDEPIERQAIRLMVNSNFPQIDSVLEAENGFEALALFRRQRVDIVMMDIEMPGMNGLEAIEELKKIDNEVTCIIVTSYSKFEYAQRAVQLGVRDFLLKPTAIEELKSTLEQVIKTIAQNRHVADIRKDEEQRLKDVRLLLERDLIKTLKSGLHSVEIPPLLGLLNINFSQGCVFIIKGLDNTSLIPERLLVQIKRMGLVIISSNDEEYLTIVVINDDAARNVPFQDLASYITNFLNAQGVYNIAISIGSIEDDPQALPHSYQQALSRHFAGEKEELEDLLSNAEVEHVVKELVSLTLKGEKVRTQQVVRDYHEQILDQLPIDLLVGHYRQLLMMVKHQVGRELPMATRHREPSDLYLSTIPQQKEKVLEEVLNILSHEIETIERLRESALNPQYQKILEFIRTNYHENLSLEQISKQFLVSTSYISRAIKMTTHATFSEYVTHVRLEKAKELLREGAHSVKEIAFAVGFSSQHYFSRIFKKHVGLAPSEYEKFN